MVWQVLKATSPVQQTEMTPGARIQSGKLRPEGKKIAAPEPTVECAKVVETEWGGNSKVAWSNSMNYFSLHLS